MKQKLTEIWSKVKSNKGKLGAAVLASVVGANVFEFNPSFKQGISEAKEVVSKVTEEVFPDKPIPEDFTSSKVVGINVWIKGEWQKLIVPISERDKLLYIQDKLGYIDDPDTLDILMMLSCQHKYSSIRDKLKKCLAKIREIEDIDETGYVEFNEVE